MCEHTFLSKSAGRGHEAVTMNDPDISGLAARICRDGGNAWGVLVEARKRKRAGQDVLILSIGEDANATSPTHVAEAGVASIRDGRHHYTGVAGEPEFREAVARHHTRITGQAAGAANVCSFAGAQNGIFSVALCLVEQGDEVIVVEPYYSTYPATFTAGGADMVVIQARAENRFEPDINEIESAVTAKTRAIVLNSPNNPTGAVYSAELMQQVVELSRKHGFWIISDEVYSDFVFDGVHVSPGKYCDVEERCVVVSSLSKSHRMSGWRSGWAVGSTEITNVFEELNLAMTYGLPGFVQDAAIAAIDGPQDDSREMVRGYGERAGLLVSALEEIPGISTIAPRAGMYVMVDTSEVADSADAFAWALMNQHNVSILPCSAFGSNVDNFLRMSLCASMDDLYRACNAIGDTARTYTKSG